jgi:hypothetical protein
MQLQQQHHQPSESTRFINFNQPTTNSQTTTTTTKKATKYQKNDFKLQKLMTF